ncbi:MAG: helix-turn-helix transcriptional regulator [Candidatus Izemoplasmatales bacterium]|jgi:transcriptional regulator with XRE-family HTH domain|nr:helix-turn-helix transcriptional regulator [Candidatus Izemoplasmatales bacterium]
MDIYDRITELLKRQKKTRKDLCASTGLSYNTMTSLFKRKSKNMRLDTIRAIADYLGTSVDFLLFGERKTAFLVKESPLAFYGQKQTEVEIELERIIHQLPLKGKIALLSKAYELEDALTDKD